MYTLRNDWKKWFLRRNRGHSESGRLFEKPWGFWGDKLVVGKTQRFSWIQSCTFYVLIIGFYDNNNTKKSLLYILL